MQEALRELKDYRKQLADKARSAVLEEYAERALGLHHPRSRDLWEMARMVTDLREALATAIEERDQSDAEVDRLARKADDLAMDKADLEADREGAEREFAKERETWRANVERLTAENNRLQRELGEAYNRAQSEQVSMLKDAAGSALADQLKSEDRAEIARLRGIIRQMVREDAERRIEALGVGEEAPE